MQFSGAGQRHKQVLMPVKVEIPDTDSSRIGPCGNFDVRGETTHRIREIQTDVLHV